MHWLRGILLGLMLTAALPFIAGALSISDRLVNAKDAMLAAIALITFCLLGVLIFKPAGARPRLGRRGAKEEEE